MIVFPAIDLKGGQCVRLAQGDMARATVYSDDPAAQARAFAAAGCEWLHVVDLDGAFSGAAANEAAVKAILDATTLKVQLGGGIRDRARIESWLAAGVTRVVLGTVAAEDPALVREAARAHPGRVVAGIDAREGRVAVRGWAETTTLGARDLALRLADSGIAAIVHTDIARDGVLSGPNVEASAELARGLGVPVVVSGGVSQLADVRRVKAAEGRGIAGVIVGRALYDGRMALSDALAVAAGERAA
jgi:phosphoribosylformimino-5-aminoimidazole carboxamide ribotide isomerase